MNDVHPWSKVRPQRVSKMAARAFPTPPWSFAKSHPAAAPPAEFIDLADQVQTTGHKFTIDARWRGEMLRATIRNTARFVYSSLSLGK